MGCCGEFGACLRDGLLVLDRETGTWTLKTHERRISAIGIKFCPWCGANVQQQKLEEARDG